MTSLGLGQTGHSEIRLGFRTGILRTFALTLGGAGGLGLVVAAFDLVRENPVQAFSLLQQQGFMWLLGLAALYFCWDLSKRAVSHLGKLADSVQTSAVAVSRIADKDDRERERMITETGYISQQLEKMSQESRLERAAQRDHNDRVIAMIRETQQK